MLWSGSLTLNIIHAMLCSNPLHNLSWRVDGSVTPCNNLSNWPKFFSVDSMRTSTCYQKLVHDNQNGIQSSYCVRCWDKESLNLNSKRLSDNQQHQIYHKIDNNYLKIDAAIGSTCNAACRICGPDSSSLWQYENKKFLDIPLIPKATMDLWQTIDQNQLHILQLDFGGGEPWLNDVDQQIGLLTRLRDSGQARFVKLRYNTNGSVYPKKLIDLLQNFREVEITLSIDDTDNRFEYNRYPLKWSRVKRNLEKLQTLAQTYSNIVLGINYSVSVFSFLYTDEFTGWAQKNKFDRINWNIVNSPSIYSIKFMPPKAKDNLDKSNMFYNLVSQTPLADWQDKFDLTTKKLDAQRKQNFARTFPELVAILK